MVHNATHLKNQHLSAFAVATVLVLLLVCNTGCQIVDTQQGKSELKTVEQIAQESVLAADSKYGQFKTITPSNAPAHQATKGIQTASPTLQLKPRNAGPNANALIDEIFDQTDIRDALQAISIQANVSIIVDDQVAGSVTTLIQNEPLEQALQKVLIPLGLHYRVVNNQYLVCNSDPSSSMFSKIADRLDYSPMFASPEELAEMLSEKNRQFVRVAAKHNMIIVEAPTEIADQIVHELQLFDRPVPQVVLEAMVVVVSPDTGFKFGTHLKQFYAEDDKALGLMIEGLELSGSVTGAIAKEMFSQFSTTSFFIRALEQEGYLSIRATPHVMAKNGEKAEISISRETYFSTQPFDPQIFVRQEIEKVETGISLVITPTIRGDYVNMVIEKAEVSEDIRATIDDPAVDNPFPLINRRQVSTTVQVKDGATVVIGGLMQNQLVDRISRVPVLNKIPLVGKLFTQTVKEEQAAEVIVFISPKIVRQNDRHPMAGNVPVVQACNEFCFQRRFPKDNGLEIGDYGPSVGYQQAAQYEAAQYDASHESGASYQSTQSQAKPVYQAPPVENYNHASETVPVQTVPVQTAPQQHVPITQQFPVQPQAVSTYQPPRYQGNFHAAGTEPRQTVPVSSQQHRPRTQHAPHQSRPTTYPASQTPTPIQYRQQSRTRQITPRAAPVHPGAQRPPNQMNPRRLTDARNPLRTAASPTNTLNMHRPEIVENFRDEAVRQAGYQQPDTHQSQVPARR